MAENNQYGNAMTKPLRIGSIQKMKKLLFLRNFDLIVKSISDEDEICYPFLIDIEFDWRNANKKQLFFSENYTPIFEKKKVLPACGRSVFLILDTIRLNDKGLINSYKTTAKPQATPSKKYAIPLYAEHFHFLINRCSC